MSEEQSLFGKAKKAIQAAADRVAEEARRTHGSVIVWENGAVREIPWDQLPPRTAVEEKDIIAE